MSELVSALNGLSGSWAEAIWRASWQGAIALAAVWIVCRTWQKMPPHLRIWLWRVAFLKLLVGLVWVRPINVPVLAAHPVPNEIAPTVLSPDLGPGRIGDLSLAPAGPGSGVVVPTLASALLAVWVVGMLWYSLRVALSWQAARRLRAELEPVTQPGLIASLADLCRTSGIGRPPALAAGATPGPLLMGIWRPVIVLPETLLRQWRPGEARLMLAHEIAHLRQRDLWWNCLAALVQGLFFFHPLLWVGRREWSLSQEIACDAVALDITRSSQAQYGGMLVRIAAHSGKPHREVAAVGIAESFEALRRRVAAMVHFAPASRKRLAVMMALLAAAAAAGLMPWRLTAGRAAGSDGQTSASASQVTTAATRGDDPMTTYPETAMLKDVPPGGPGCNSYARGLETALNYAGTPADAATIMGDTGMAFIIMSEESGPLIDGAVDVGWWPMASWGLEMRLDFLARTVGREIRLVPADAARYRTDPAGCYRAQFEREVKASIAARRPPLVVHDMCFVVYGYDEGDPPLLGNWAAEDKRETIRIERYPWALIVLGEETDRLDRKEADLAALRHAVALARDEIAIRLPAYWGEWETVTARYTGQKSYALWAQMLRDAEHLGQARWHSNMVFHLGLNRRNAVIYLRAMADRHPGRPAAHLRAAADLYDQVLALLETADTREAAMMSKPGREKLAKLAEGMAEIEARAATEIEQALAAMGSGQG